MIFKYFIKYNYFYRKKNKKIYMACIGFGHFSKYYTYIFMLVFFRFLCDYLEGFNEKEYYKRSEDESFIEFASIIAYHPLVRDFMYFLGSLTCGLFLYIIYLKTEVDDKENKISLEQFVKIKRTMLGLSEEFSTLFIVLISFIYTANIALRTFLMSMKFDAGFWTLEILFVIFLSTKILKVKIGNHQKVTIFILACILFIVQIITSVLPRTDHGCEDDDLCKDIYITDNNMYDFMTKKFGHYGWIFLILFLYVFDFIMRDYSWVKLKYLMDVKSIPVFRIMVFIGMIGCFIIIICFSIVSAVPCNVIENVVKSGNNYMYSGTNTFVDFSRQVCGVIDFDEETQKLYFYYDKFSIFISDYSNSSREGLEIFIIFFYFINNFFINFTHAMILKHLDPNAMLVNINFNYFFSRLISYIKNHAKKEFMLVEQFILLEFCEIFAIIAYMIYIELIELKFCRLDYHLRKNIEQRSMSESQKDNILMMNNELEQDDYKVYYVDNPNKSIDIGNRNNSEKSMEMANKDY